MLANRSALWAQLGEPHRVEEDVALALEAGGSSYFEKMEDHNKVYLAHMLHTGYPEDLKFKLLERRAKARQSLGKLEEGITDIETAIAALDKANLAQEKREVKKSELQRCDLKPWLDSIDGRIAG